MQKIRIYLLLTIIPVLGLNAQVWQMEVLAIDKIGIGVSSTNNYGGIFMCLDKSRPDLVIAGNPSISFGYDCVLAADPTIVSSDLFLQANDDITLEFNKNNSGESAKFEVKTGAGDVVYHLGDNGIATLNGDQSVFELKSSNASNGSVLVLNNETPSLFNYTGAINFNNVGSTPGQIAYSSSHTMDFRVHNVNSLMKLSDGANHIIMSNGAKLTSGGMWMDVSSREKKNLQSQVNAQNILAALTQLPIYQWSYKAEPNSLHLGPTAEDFYDLFGMGPDAQSLSPADLAATSVAGIQALAKENTLLKEELAALKEEVASIKKEIGKTPKVRPRKRKNH